MVEGHIYFVQGGHPDALIKIGWAKNPLARLKTLQACSPIPLTLLGTRAGTVLQEQALHRKLSYARFHGEWFAPVEEVLKEVPDFIPEKAYSAISYPGVYFYWKPYQAEIARRKNAEQNRPRLPDFIHFGEEVWQQPQPPREDLLQKDLLTRMFKEMTKRRSFTPIE